MTRKRQPIWPCFTKYRFERQILKVRVCAVCKRQGSCFVSGIDAGRFTVQKERHRRFLWDTLPHTIPLHPKSSLHGKKTLKDLWWGCRSAALHSGWLLAGVQAGKEGLAFFQGAAGHWKFGYAPVGIRATQIWLCCGLYFFLLFSFWGCFKGEGRPRRTGQWVWSGLYHKNSQIINKNVVIENVNTPGNRYVHA